LFSDECAHVNDLDNLAFTVSFKCRASKPKLDGPPLTLLAGGQVVGVPLPANVRACDRSSPLIVAIKGLSIK